MKIANLYFKLILFLIIICNISFVSSTETCFVSGINTTICFDTDSEIYPQNIDLWEGDNERYGVHIVNPDDDLNYNIFVKQIRNSFDTGKIDVTKLGDNTKFDFQNVDDFYNLVQQKNAIGNVTLFTIADLNQETRERNILLTTEVLNWSITFLTIVMELFKMVFSLVTILLMIFLFFRLIPLSFRFMLKLVFMLAMGTSKK